MTNLTTILTVRTYFIDFSLFLFCFVFFLFSFENFYFLQKPKLSPRPVLVWPKKARESFVFPGTSLVGAQGKEVKTSCICARKSSTVDTGLFKIFIDIFFSLIFYLPQKFELTLLWHIFSLPSSNLSLIRFFCQTQWTFGSKPLETNSSSHIKNQINCVPQVANINIKYKPTVG